MAERKAILPSQRQPFIGSDNRINTTWYRFLVDLHERTGGGATDKVEVSAGAAEGAQASADAAAASATAAQIAADEAQLTADSVENKFDFGLDLELR